MYIPHIHLSRTIIVKRFTIIAMDYWHISHSFRLEKERRVCVCVYLDVLVSVAIDIHLYTYVNKRFHDVTCCFFLANARKKNSDSHASQPPERERERGVEEKKPTGKRIEEMNKESSKRWMIRQKSIIKPTTKWCRELFLLPLLSGLFFAHICTKKISFQLRFGQ